MKWLSSLDELLYEVMSSLVFFPMTLWRTLVRPLQTMSYADAQLALPQEEQYADALSPPLFLALALILAHGVSSALGRPDEIVTNRHGLAGLVTDDGTALILRLLVFAGFPLVMSVRLVRARRQPITRASMRAPFYAQCYPVAVFALGLSLGTSLVSIPSRDIDLFGSALIIASMLFYIGVQTRWFCDQLELSTARGFTLAFTSIVSGFALLFFVGFLFTR